VNRRSVIYYLLRNVQKLFPDFHPPKTLFNTGVFVGESGVVERADFEPFVLFEPDHIQLRHPDVFTCLEQGVLFHVLNQLAQTSRLRLQNVPFHLSIGQSPGPNLTSIIDGQPDDSRVLHWAGPKPDWFWRNKHWRLLWCFDRLYHSRLPQGTCKRYERAALRGLLPLVLHVKRLGWGATRLWRSCFSKSALF
jgi:hypothetical protein